MLFENDRGLSECFLWREDSNSQIKTYTLNTHDIQSGFMSIFDS